ncbi:MAG: DUF5684 domain-containing protein [Micrococcales bacterium]|nr:DUF5684 domain-containing protein [Micrococcales bacterium]
MVFMIVVSSVVATAMYVWTSVTLGRVFGALGSEPVKAWLPLVNMVVLFRLADRSGWQVLALVVPVYGLVVMYQVLHHLTTAFGRPGKLAGIGVLVLPIWAGAVTGGVNAKVVASQGKAMSQRGVDSIFGGSSAQHPVPSGPEPDPTPSPSFPQPQTPPAQQAVAQQAAAQHAAQQAAAQQAAAHQAAQQAAAQQAAQQAAAHQAAQQAVAQQAAQQVAAHQAAAQQAAQQAAAYQAAQQAAAQQAVAQQAAQQAAAQQAAAQQAAAQQAAAVQPVAQPAQPAVVQPVTPQAAQPAPVAPAASQSTPASGRPALLLPTVVQDSRWSGPADQADGGAAPAPVHPVGEPVAPVQVADVADHTVVVNRRSQHPWSLVLDDGRAFDVWGSSVVVGREPTATDTGVQMLAISDDTRTISKMHARFDLVEGAWSVTDLNSTNGIVVTGSDGRSFSVRRGGTSVVGNKLKLGSVGMRLTPVQPLAQSV